MSSRFKPANRQQARLRMAIDGSSGAGKTFTALRFAMAFGDPARIAVIDTEHGSASKYVGEKPDGKPWQFDTLELFTFAPTEYTAAIEEAGQHGYDVLVIDSLSHAWEGKDGALELVDKAKGGNRYTAWKDVTPVHRRMVDAILTSPCHVICTMRSKTEYILQTDEKTGKQIPCKIGMQPIQRAGMEYEFDVYASMDQSHTLSVSKTRCPAIDGIVVVKPSATFMRPLLEWLSTGQASTPTESTASRQRLTNEQLTALVQITLAHNLQGEKLESELLRKFQVRQLIDLTAVQADDLIRRWGTATTEVAAAPDAPTEAVVADTPAVVPVAMVTKDQLETIRLSLFGLRGVGKSLTKEQWAGVLSKRGVTREADLTAAQADEIIAAMKARAAAGSKG